MLGLPWWAWVLIVIVVVMATFVRLLYSRWRGMCRGVREDLTALLGQTYPEVQVLREEMGNLVVRMNDGSERIWEMADIYAEVARQPGLGRDRNLRQPIYHRALASLFAPPSGGPLSLAVHREWIKPMLVPQDSLDQSPDVPHVPLPQLGLAAIYILDVPNGKRHLTDQDRRDLAVDVDELHQLAVGNLGKNFPADALDSVRQGSGSAIQCNDTFDATRLLLLPERMTPGEELVAFIPHRDMIVLLPGSIREDPEKLRQGIEAIECSEHPPLLKRDVLVRSNGLELI